MSDPVERPELIVSVGELAHRLIACHSDLSELERKLSGDAYEHWDKAEELLNQAQNQISHILACLACEAERSESKAKSAVKSFAS